MTATTETGTGTTTAEPGTFSFDDIVSKLAERGITAYVEQTGGGCATIYAASGRDVAALVNAAGQGEAPGVVVAGPGYFAGPGWTDARGHVGDFYVGPDDQGETTPDAMPAGHTAPVGWALVTIAKWCLVLAP